MIVKTCELFFSGSHWVDFILFIIMIFYYSHKKSVRKTYIFNFFTKNKALTSGNYNGLLILRNLQNNKSCNQEIP